MSEQEYIISELAESESTELTESLYNELLGSLCDSFDLKLNDARKILISVLRGLYVQ